MKVELSLIFFIAETDSLENILEDVTILIKAFYALFGVFNCLFPNHGYFPFSVNIKIFTNYSDK